MFASDLQDGTIWASYVNDSVNAAMQQASIDLLLRTIDFLTKGYLLVAAALCMVAAVKLGQRLHARLKAAKLARKTSHKKPAKIEPKGTGEALQRVSRVPA